MIDITPRDLRHADREVISVEPQVTRDRRALGKPAYHTCWIGRVSRDDKDLFSIVADDHEEAYRAAVNFYADLLVDRMDAEHREADRQEREDEARSLPEIDHAAPRRI